MQTEFETKILEIDIDEIVAKLKKLDATEIGEKFYKRYVFDFTPKKENSWIRLRTDGDTTTLTIKDIQNNNIDGTKELEVTVDDFDKTKHLLEKLGYKPKGYQENKRTSYLLNRVEIEIDSWPMIPTYLEIEGKSIEAVERIVELLEYDLSQTTSINTLLVYKKYGIDIEEIDELKF